MCATGVPSSIRKPTRPSPVATSSINRPPNSDYRVPKKILPRNAEELSFVINKEMDYVNNLIKNGNFKLVLPEIIGIFIDKEKLRCLELPLAPKINVELMEMKADDFRKWFQEWYTRPKDLNLIIPKEQEKLINKWAKNINKRLMDKDKREAEEKSAFGDLFF